MTQDSALHINCSNCNSAGLCLPHGLQRDEVLLLNTIVKNRRPMQPGELLFWQGQTCKSLYAVKSGSFRCFIADADGSEQNIGFYLPGEFMGLDAFQHGRFTCSTVSLETSTVCELPLAHLYDLCLRTPSLQRQLMWIVGKAIAADHDKILLAHRPAKQRMASFLMILSQRYAVLGYSRTHFNLSMSRYDIANFLGMTIETVSRQLGLLGRLGIITVKQRRVRINDLQALRLIADASQQNYAAGRAAAG